MRAYEFWSDVALEHQFVERSCGDHTVEACSCGYNDRPGFDPVHEYGLYDRHVRAEFRKAAEFAAAMVAERVDPS